MFLGRSGSPQHIKDIGFQDFALLHFSLYLRVAFQIPQFFKGQNEVQEPGVHCGSLVHCGSSWFIESPSWFIEGPLKVRCVVRCVVHC